MINSDFDPCSLGTVSPSPLAMTLQNRFVETQRGTVGYVTMLGIRRDDDTDKPPRRLPDGSCELIADGTVERDR